MIQLNRLIFGHNLSRSSMSNNNIQTFGEKVRYLREMENMPLRKLSALLDIDQSTLSKIERGERNPNVELINKLSSIFRIQTKELQMCYLSDKVANEILLEEDGSEILRLAELKVEYLKSKIK